jgi:hypothetical protein
MSELQQEAVRMIGEMTDDNLIFLIEVINRLILNGDEGDKAKQDSIVPTKKMQAFKSLDEDRNEISQILPYDFDSDKELEEARAQRFESFD